jgi:hypothetical protein
VGSYGFIDLFGKAGRDLLSLNGRVTGRKPLSE